MFTGIVEATAQVLERSPSRLTLARPKGFSDVRTGSSISVSGVCLTIVKLTKGTPLRSASHFALRASRHKSRSYAGQVAAMMFDVIPETLKRTTLGNLKVGDRVNLERAMLISRVIPPAGRSFSEGWSSPAPRASIRRSPSLASLGMTRGAGRIEGRFEGHIVQGHVDGVGEIIRVMLSSSAKRGISKHGGGVILTISYPSLLRGRIVEKGSIAVDGVSLTVAHVTENTFSVALIPHTLKETTLGELKEGNKVNLEGDVIGRYAWYTTLHGKR